MRWFKHMTLSSQDEKLCHVTTKLGLEGYGFYWRILEIIALQMDKTDRTFCTYSFKTWSKFCGISVKKLSKFIKTLEEFQLFSVEIREELLTIHCPNLLKYKDEYSGKQRKCRDNVVSVSGVCPPQIQSIDTKVSIHRKPKELKPIAGSDKNPSPLPAVLTIPLVGSNGKEFHVTQADIDQWQETFPAVDILPTLRKIRQWNLDRPRQRKTFSGIRKHISTWLGKEQDRGCGRITSKRPDDFPL